MKLLIVLTLLLVACTPPPNCESQGYIRPNQCPTTNCPEAPQTDEEYLYIHFIDVDQGDSILIKYENQEMLIDCGKNSEGHDVLDYLEDEGVTEIDYLLVTHPDSDHIGGCDEVIKGMRTNTIIMNGEDKETFSYKEFMREVDDEQLIIARKGHSWTIGPANIEVIQVSNDYDDSNQNSIVTKLTHVNTEVLLTGDCDRECEEELISKDIRSDILKVAHHGSKFGSNEDFLRKVRPEVAIISVGENNNYGHPARETLDRLNDEGVTIYRTDLRGDIIVKSDGNGYEVI